MIVEDAMTAILRRMSKRYTRFEHLAHAVAPPEPDPDRTYMLYLHVPFCQVLCPFCSFHRVEFREDKASRYFKALRSEIELFHGAGYRFGEIYVGGGTPTVMVDELARTLDTATRLNPIRQISIETNPDDLVPERLDPLRTAGVNRLSVGVQSLENRLLREMQRYEKYGSSELIQERLAAVDGLFDTLNVDMIFNLPHQSMDSMLRDLEILTGELRVDQVSCYPLMGSKTTTRAMKKEMGLVSYGRERRFYQAILENIGPGYVPSSAWCFSKSEGAIDEYIIEQDQYLGLGSGAMSYVGGQLYASSFSINRYIRLVESGHCGITRRAPFSEQDQMRYDFLMSFFGLRVAKRDAEARWNGRFASSLWKEFAAFRAVGAIRDEGDAWRLTERGMYYWVLMMREFFIAVSDFRDLMRLGIRSELDPQDRVRPSAA
jgi:coproporphyrinogen III oxidase-like Fe-S oxidoreductase